METNEKVVNESIVNPFEENKRYDEYLTKLDNLRMDGENKVIQLKGENRDIKLNKLIDKGMNFTYATARSLVSATPVTKKLKFFSINF